MKTWAQIVNGVTKLLEENLITYEVTGDVIHTDLCTIEFSGSPWKPEYWVNETKVRFSEIVDSVHRCI